MTAKEIVDIIWTATEAIGALGLIGLFIYCAIKGIK